MNQADEQMILFLHSNYENSISFSVAMAALFLFFFTFSACVLLDAPTVAGPTTEAILSTLPGVYMCVCPVVDRLSVGQ